MAIVALDVRLVGGSSNTYLFGPTIISECRFFSSSSASLFQNVLGGYGTVSSSERYTNTYVFPDVKLTLTIGNGTETTIYEQASDLVGQTLVQNGTSYGDPLYSLPNRTFNYTANKLEWIATYVKSNKVAGNVECKVRLYTKIPSGANSGSSWMSTSYKLAGTYTVSLLISNNRKNITQIKGKNPTAPHWYQNALCRYLVNGESTTLECNVTFGWDIVSYTVSCSLTSDKYEEKNYDRKTGGTETITFQWQRTYTSADNPNELYKYIEPEYSVTAKDYLGNSYSLDFDGSSEMLWVGFVHYNTFVPIVESMNCVRSGNYAKFTAQVKCNPMPFNTSLWNMGGSGGPTAYLNPPKFDTKYYYLIDKNTLINSEEVAATTNMTSMSPTIVTFNIEAIGAVSLTTNRSWWIKVNFKDNYGSSNAHYFVFPCATAFVDFNDDAQHLAIGKLQETTGLECQWDVKFAKDVIYLAGGKQMSDCAKNIPYTDTYGIGATNVQQAINWIMNKLGG